MGIHYDDPRQLNEARKLQYRPQLNGLDKLRKNFDENVLLYLDDKIIGHLCDSLFLEEINLNHSAYTDFSFLTAPAYKAFEGFLFQIAKELKLPAGKDEKLVGGYYYKPEEVHKAIDGIIVDLEKTSGKVTDKDRKDHLKAVVSEMGRYLKRYRHAPSHYYGEPLTTKDKAWNHVHSIYNNINETVLILQESKLIKTPVKPKK